MLKMKNDDELFVDGFEGLYSVNKNGSVFSHVNNNYVKENQSDGRYKRVGLAKNGIVKKYFVHRLVALSFIPNPLNKPTVNHIDGNKFNNHVDNLEWATMRENIRHKYDVLGYKNKRKNDILQKRWVYSYWGDFAYLEVLGFSKIRDDVWRLKIDKNVYLFIDLYTKKIYRKGQIGRKPTISDTIKNIIDERYVSFNIIGNE